MAPKRRFPGPPKHGGGDDASEEGFMNTLIDLIDGDGGPGTGGGTAAGGDIAQLVSNDENTEHNGDVEDLQQVAAAVESVYPFLVRASSPGEEARVRQASITSDAINALATAPPSSRQSSMMEASTNSTVSTASSSTTGNGERHVVANNSAVQPTKAVMESLEHMSYSQLFDYAVIVTTLLQQQIFLDKHRKALQLHLADNDHRDRAESAVSFSYSMRSFLRPALQETTRVTKREDDEGSWLNHYLILSELGKGAYGKVLLALNTKTSDPVAIKCMERSISKHQQSVARREIAVMKKLRHKNVVPLLEVLDDPQKSKIYMVMQYVENGPLVKLEKTLTCVPLAEDIAARYLRQLLSGLGYLHNHDIVHRDIKPDNILIDKDGTPYLVDFGVSELVSSDKKEIKGLEGTAFFLAPETFGAQKGYKGPPTDVWALGVTFYAAVVGTLPFKGKNMNEIEDAVTSAQPKFPATLSARWKEVLSAMLQKDPAKRATIKELKAMRLFGSSNDEAGAFRMQVTAEEEAGCVGLVVSTSGEKRALAESDGSNEAKDAIGEDEVKASSAEFVEQALQSLPAQAQSRLRRVLNNARARANAWGESPVPQPPSEPRPPSSSPQPDRLRVSQSGQLPPSIPPINRAISSKRLDQARRHNAAGDDDDKGMLNSFSHTSPRHNALPAISGASPRGVAAPKVTAGPPNTGRKPVLGRR